MAAQAIGESERKRGPRRAPLRLGVYADLVYHRRGDSVSTYLSFIGFVTNLADRVEELVIFGRLDPAGRPGPYRLPDGVRFVALPHYPRVTSLGRLARSLPASYRAVAAELDRLDVIWLFGPHPLSLAVAVAARRRGKAVALGVRQDYPLYVRHRLPGRLWAWAVPVAHLLERAFRLIARRVPAVVVGEQLGRRYAPGRARVLTTGFSLVRATDVVSVEEALARSWSGELRLLSVGRIDFEKNPLLLPAVLARLRECHPGWRLTVAGDGPLAGSLAARAVELGVGDMVELLGDVPHGEALRDLYRSSHALLHVSLTEGVPQVLFEAQAAGLPIVATDVGGVRAALAGGATGLLVPPSDAASAVGALERLRTNEALRRGIVTAAIEQVAGETVEAQLDRLETFLLTQARA